MSGEANDADLYFMSIAIKEAKKAARLGETPVGAVVVRDGEIVSKAHNLRESGRCALFHAETMAVYLANRALGGWRLPGCAIYVTLEPCPMCAGAIVNSRIERVVFGASDPKAGCFGSVINFNDLPFNHKPLVTGGVMEEECAALLSDFFSSLRRK